MKFTATTICLLLSTSFVGVASHPGHGCVGGCSVFATATCANTYWGKCTCTEGYTGDGYTCTDTDECSTNRGGCSADADCYNTAGSFTCHCRSGYTGDGRTCRPIIVNCPEDIIFVVDESASITTKDSHLMKLFLSHLVRRLDVDRRNTRVGLVSFSTDLKTKINLNDHTSVKSLETAIADLGTPDGLTNTHLALKYVRETLLTSAAGDRSNAPNVVVVLTDGQSTLQGHTKAEVDKLKQITSGHVETKVVALGIGNSVNRTELEYMASAPESKNVIWVKDFGSLDHVEGQLVSTTCTSGGGCVDIDGHYVKNGEHFSPAGTDRCTFCVCVNGMADDCLMKMCAAPRAESGKE